VLFAFVAACDLKPAPKQAPPAATPAAPMVPADAAAAGAPSDAATPMDAMSVSDRCVTLGSHVAEVLIGEAEDPSKKAALVQDRAKIVRRTAESCTRDAWSEDQISCFLAGKTQIAMQACRKPNPVPPPAAQPPSDDRPR